MSDSSESNRSSIVERSRHAVSLRLAELKVGQTFSVEHRFDSDDIDTFAALSGDYSPLHIDLEYATGTEFGNRVVHGMLLASLFSTLVGMTIPGRTALYLSQDLNFRRPVLVGETVIATAKISSINQSLGVIQLTTTISKSDGSVAVTGSGKVKLRESFDADTVAEVSDRELPETTGTPVALVTGASRGIGAAVARRLAADGFTVVVNYRASKQEAAQVVASIKTKGGIAQAIQTDIRDEDASSRMIEQIGSEFGRLDLLVNNAAQNYETKPALKVARSDIAGHLESSVYANLRLCQMAFGILKNHQGAIVNILSQVVEGTPPQQMLDYVVGKYGLLGLTRALAAEWAGDGVRVNGVAPSLVETDMTSHFKDRVFKLEASRTPLRRLAEPEDVAASVSYLGGKDAAFLTGLVLPVTGGQVMK